MALSVNNGEPETPQISTPEPFFNSSINNSTMDDLTNDVFGINENGVLDTDIEVKLPNIQREHLLDVGDGSVASNNTSLEVEVSDELPQFTHSHSMSMSISNDIEDQSNGSLSDSQLMNVGKDDLRKLKKQKKRNRISQMISGVSHKSKSDLFQKLFKDMANDELLVADFSCALQRDILVHGRLYLSQNWLCFYANIFGWETLVTIQWIEITAITKEKTAKLIPNAIQIFTSTDKFFFSTFVTRERSYTALFRIWQNALLGQALQPAELKKICKNSNRKIARDPMDGYPINDEHDETGDEMHEDDDTNTTNGSFGSNTNKMDDSAIYDTYETDGGGTIPNGILYSDITGDVHCIDGVDINGTLKPGNSGMNSADIEVDQITSLHKNINLEIPKRARHIERPPSPLSKLNFRRKKHKVKHEHQRPKYPSYHLDIPDREDEDTTTDDNESDDPEPDDDVLCPCHDSHKGKEYVNEEFNFDVDALYEHLFSQESDMMKKVFEVRKFENVKYTPYKKDVNGTHSQILSYTIPLNYSIGPKVCDTASKHIMQKENRQSSFYVVDTENTTTGVPYGESFYVSTRYCITRASGNRSRLKVTMEIIYIKKVFGLVKNMISRGTDEALKDYMDFLVNVLKSESDLICFAKVKPKNKYLLTKTKSAESMKSIHHEKPSRSMSLGEHAIKTSTEKQNIYTGLNITKTSLRGFALMFCLLFLMNVYMLSRLSTLETNILSTKKHYWFPKELPTTKEEWNNLLEYQKNLHQLELHKLKEVIGNTASLLQQVQISIKSLHDDIEKTIVDRRVKQANFMDEYFMKRSKMDTKKKHSKEL